MMINLHDKPIPWIVPKLSEPLIDMFLKNGCLESYKKDSVILDENHVMDRLFYIKSGILSQAVVNFNLNKPLAMNIFTPGRMMGYLNFFTGTNSPRRILTLEKSEIIVMKYEQVESILEKDIGLYKRLVNYCELCDRSELNGMIGLFSLQAEDRFRLYFTNILCAYDYRFNPSDDEQWVKVPIRLRRDDIIKIIYTSRLTLDRLSADWIKRGVLKREGRYFYIKPSNIRQIYNWVNTIGGASPKEF